MSAMKFTIITTYWPHWSSEYAKELTARIVPAFYILKTKSV